MVRIASAIGLALLGVIVFIWQRREGKVGPQELRLKGGNVRVPPQLATRKSPKIQGQWALWVAIPIGGLAIVSFFAMKFLYGYQAATLMDQGQTITATVTTDRMPREDCHYVFAANGQEYHGRGPESLSKGDQLTVRYDPANPRKNRPDEGLVMDILIAVGLAGALVVAAVLIFSRRKLSFRDQRISEDLSKLLGAGNFHQAVKVFGTMDESHRPGAVLDLADLITGAACVRGDTETFDRARRALRGLQQAETDPARQRELACYLAELDTSQGLCQRAGLT